MNLAFFVLFLARIFWFYLFILDILENPGKLPDSVRRFSPIVFVLSELTALASPFTHAVFSFDAAGYHRGACYNVLYVCFFFYLLAALLLLLSRYRRLPAMWGRSLLAVIFILIIGNILRMLLPQLLVMNTFCLMAILVIYLSFENPDLFLSDRGSAFNSRAFKIVLTEWEQRNYRLLAFVIRHYREARGIYGGTQMDATIGQINNYLTTSNPDCLVFYLRNGAFAIIDSESMDSKDVCSRIARRFQKPWGANGAEILLKPSFVEADLEKKTETADRVVSTLLLALENAENLEYADEHAAPLSIHAIDQYLAEKRALELALEGDGLEVFLQPLVDSHTGKLVGAEALARLRGEDGRMILPPSAFIPIAEKDGSIIALGEQVLRKTCRFIRDNDIAALGLQWINVNLSPYQCMSRDLAERFRAILEEYSVAPGADPSGAHGAVHRGLFPAQAPAFEAAGAGLPVRAGRLRQRLLQPHPRQAVPL